MDRKDRKPGITVLTTYGSAQPRPTPTPSERRDTHVHREEYEKRPTHGLAVASLVFGVLGFIGLFIIGPILALVFGYMARSRIKEDPHFGGDGMAIAGIVLGWIGLLLQVVLIAFGFVSLEMFNLA